MKLIDAHHHYWDPDQNPHPWLQPAGRIPFRYGDYQAICRPFLPQDYAAATKGFDVVASVTMEGEWDSQDPTGEAVWMSELAALHGTPAAHVAQAWLDREDLAAVLERYQDLPLVRSVRHKPWGNSAPAGPPGQLTKARFRQGFRRLARENLLFDLQTPWWHLEEAIDLASYCPDVPIVLNHGGLPADRSPEGIAGWKAAIQALATVPQVFVKISGLGLSHRPWRFKENAEIIVHLIESFGPERAMFASNFPVDSLCGSFSTIYQGFAEVARSYSPAEQQHLFCGTAQRVYRLPI